MPGHVLQAWRRNFRAVACVVVAVPWLALCCLCLLQPSQSLWLLRAFLLAALATVQPHSPLIFNYASTKPKRQLKCLLDGAAGDLRSSRESDLLMSSSPRVRQRVSTSKPISSNRWTPRPSTALSGTTCSNKRTASTTTAGKGSTPSSNQPCKATTGSTSSTATPAAARSCFNSGSNGGWDGSDDGGGGGERPRFQAVKSHSLDAPDSAAIAVAAAESESSNSGSNAVAAASVPSSCATVPSGNEAEVAAAAAEAVADDNPPSASPPASPSPSPAAAAAAATTGPWKLSSPFAAAMTPFGSSSGSSGAAAPASAAKPSPPAAAVTGPWKLSSPFAAAPLPDFSTQLNTAAADNAAVAAAAAAANIKAPAAQQNLADVKQQQDLQQQQQQQQQVVPSGKGTTGPWALHSPFAAAGAAALTLEVVDDVASSSSTASIARSPKATVTLADPFGSPVPAQFGVDLQTTAAASSNWAAADAVTMDPNAPNRDSKMTPVPASPRTGPWALYSPFAAAGAAQTQNTTPPETASGSSSSAARPGTSTPSRRSGSGEENRNLGLTSVDQFSDQALFSRDSSSDRLTESAAGGSSSIRAVSEPQCSLPISFPSVGISAGESDAHTAVTSVGTSCTLHDISDDDQIKLHGSDLAAAAAADESAVAGLQALPQQQQMGGTGNSLHDSAYSHPLPKVMATAAAGAAPGMPAVLVATGSSSQRTSFETPTAAIRTAPAAAPWPGKLKIASALSTAAGRNTVAGEYTAAAAGAAAAVGAKSISCLCCYPPCVTEGLAMGMNVYVASGSSSSAASPHAAAGAGMLLRAVVFRGPVMVTDVTGLCRPGDGLFRVSLPALPVGPLQLCVCLEKQLCFTQTLLVLPGPAAQELTLLWGSLLQTHLAARQQQKQDKQQRAKFGSESRGSAAWNSDGSASSAASSSSGSSRRSGQQQQGGVNGVSAGDVQLVWQKQFSPVLVDIAYMLTAQSSRLAAAVVRPAAAAAVPASPTAAGAAGCSPRAAASAAQQQPFSMDSPDFKMMVTHLVQFLAANGLWAVLQMVTDSVYGVGASAKALYTAKAASSAAASAAASTKGFAGGSGGSSGSSGSRRLVCRTSQAVQVPEETVDCPEIEAAAGSNKTDRAVSCIPGLLPPAVAAVDAGAAVASALAAAEAGDSMDLSAVVLLLLLALKNNVVRGIRFSRAKGLAPALVHLGRVLGGWLQQLGLRILQAVTLLVVGMAWVYTSIKGLVSKEKGSAALLSSPTAAAATAMQDANGQLAEQ